MEPEIKHWLQIKADVYNLPQLKPIVSEAACLGAALLGRKALENIEDFSSLVNSIVKVKQLYEPNPTTSTDILGAEKLYKRLYPALKQCIFKN